MAVRPVPVRAEARVDTTVKAVTEAEVKVAEQAYEIRPPTVRTLSIPWVVVHAVTPLARIIAWASLDGMRVAYDEIRSRTSEVARRIFDQLKECLKRGEHRKLEDIVTSVASEFNVDLKRLASMLVKRWPRITVKLASAEGAWEKLFITR
ncbi:hypothetical protein B6U99_05020 [Candidatus Geothermarchaeota archaeon ex4572_27]|nr:MAG: hypothetical protein B6U99_05020 [Candidatus Geothermarchaeota archaeon ex4572_27]